MSQEDTEDLGNPVEEAEPVQEDEEVEAPKPVAKRYKKAGPDDGRKKRERTPAQIAAWERCRAKREENRTLRKQEDEAAAAEQKTALEKKVVKKAVKIKKKVLVREAVLDDVSEESDDSDIDIQAVRQIIKAKKKRRARRRPSPSPEPSDSDPEPAPAERSGVYFL